MNIFVRCLLVLFFVSCNQNKKDVIPDVYHGQTITDPYRHLERVEDTTVIDWIKQQNKKTATVIQKLDHRQGIIDKLEAYDQKRNFKIRRLQVADNGFIFYLKRKANEDVAKLYYKKGINDKEIELFDPKDFQPELNTKNQINYIKPSWDGSKIAISINHDENEYSKIIVQEVSSKKIYPDIIDHCKPTSIAGIQWLFDNSSIIYSYLPNANTKNRNASHDSSSVVYTIGKNPKTTTSFSKENNPEIGMRSEDFPMIYVDHPNTDYILGIVGGATPFTDAYYITKEELDQKKQNWKPLFKKEDRIKSYHIDNDSIIYMTANNSPNYKICKTSIITPDFENPKVIADEKEEEVIKYFMSTKRGLLFSTGINGVATKLYYINKGIEKEIKLPKPYGDIKLYRKGEDILVVTKGWLSDIEQHLFNFDTETLENFNVFPDKFIDDFADLVVEEVTVTSHDGAEVPLSLVYKKGTQKNGSTPVVMRAYGAYGVSMVPNSYYPFLFCAREGAIYAVAHVRGGGEKGDDWHKGGHKTTKPNSWKDFIACTEYLINNKYTSKGKVAIWSGSAGGVVIGRAMTERPDLYNAVIIDRGILNTIRIESGVNGANTAKEFGSIKDSIGFKGLLSMDSYHHVKDNTEYPATLLTTGANDTRVPQWHSMKFAARLQEANTSNNPILLKTEFDAGHGLQFTKTSQFESIAEALSFAFWQTGHPEYQPNEK